MSCSGNGRCKYVSVSMWVFVLICCYEKKKNIEGKKIEALELSTTVVRLELYMHILLSNAGTYGDVLFAFSMHGTPKKILGLAAAFSRCPFGMPCHIAVSLPRGDSFLTRCLLTRPSAYVARAKPNMNVYDSTQKNCISLLGHLSCQRK